MNRYGKSMSLPMGSSHFHTEGNSMRCPFFVRVREMANDIPFVALELFPLAERAFFFFPLLVFSFTVERFSGRWPVAPAWTSPYKTCENGDQRQMLRLRSLILFFFKSISNAIVPSRSPANVAHYGSKAENGSFERGTRSRLQFNWKIYRLRKTNQFVFFS